MCCRVAIKRRQRTVAEAPQHPVADIDGANRRVAVGELQGAPAQRAGRRSGTGRRWTRGRLIAKDAQIVKDHVEVVLADVNKAAVRIAAQQGAVEAADPDQRRVNTANASETLVGIDNAGDQVVPS